MRDLTITLPGRVRPRRLRRTGAIRDLVAETRISPDQFILPHFVLPAERAEEPVPSMPGISLMGVETLLGQVESDLALGIRSVLLFGHPVKGTKSPGGEAAADGEGAVQRAVSRLKATFGDDLVVMTDVCLCAYTDHGHCGLIKGGDVDNDSSLRPLVRDRAQPRPGGRRRGRPVGHDGRAGGGHPRRARRRGARERRGARIQRQVRIRILRSVPRRGGLRARPGRPAELPDGRPERARGDPGSGAR